MKKILLIITGIIAIAGINSCTKDTVNGDVSAYEMGAYLAFSGDVPGTQLFDLADITNSTVSVDVTSVGSEVDKVNIYVGSSTDGSDWKLIKTVDFNGSATLSVSGSELATALGLEPGDFTAGDEFTFFNEVVTKDGRKFSLANTSTDFESQSSYKMAMRWYASIFCAFDASVFTGNFTVITDEWADYSEGDVIVNAVEPGPGTNQLTLHVYPNTNAYPDAIVYDPIIVDVDPSTNEATVADVHYGDYGGGYDMNASGSGSVSSCSKTITLSLDHHVGNISFGEYKLVIQKKE